MGESGIEMFGPCSFREIVTTTAICCVQEPQSSSFSEESPRISAILKPSVRSGEFWMISCFLHCSPGSTTMLRHCLKSSRHQSNSSDSYCTQSAIEPQWIRESLNFGRIFWIISFLFTSLWFVWWTVANSFGISWRFLASNGADLAISCSCSRFSTLWQILYHC